MKPLDPRLLRYARSVRGFLVLTVVFGALTAVAVIVQARALATVIVDVTAGGADLDTVRDTIVVLVLAFAARGLLAWASEVAAFRAGARAKAELRDATLASVLDAGPIGPAGQSPAELAAVVTRGIDALDAYFARYLPQLVLAVIVPVAVLATVLGQDLLSAVIIAVTLPLIPGFMILIGLYTKSRVDAQWTTLATLSGHFLDLIAGLPALKIVGRARAQAQAIQRIGEDYRTTTMGVLRVSFLSSLALELLATLSVALVAVSVGLRLDEAQISYFPALFVLLLAPEAYLPLRLVGQHFHAAAEGLGAAERMLTLIEQTSDEQTSDGRPPLADARGADNSLDANLLDPGRLRALQLTDVTVRYPGREQLALASVSFTAARGEVVVLAGTSGGGKTTLLRALLGFVPLSSGSVGLVDADGIARSLDTVPLDAWRGAVGWVPQHAHLVDAQASDSTSVRAALRLGAPAADDSALLRALEQAGIAAEVEAAGGLDAVIGADGQGWSVGQRQRLAVARALVRDPAVLLLDEPTAALDLASEQALVRTIRAAAERGTIVIAVAHRPALLNAADVVVRIGAAPGVAASPLSAAERGVLTTLAGGW